MEISSDLMGKDEEAALILRALYRRYGYSRFKMGKFEEYDLYMKNKDFVDGDSIIVFQDRNGKLMALRPDLTLSVIKNFRPAGGVVKKVCCSERIYRADRNSGTYKEILQTGIECMGEVDLYHICEVTALAVKSLAAVSSSWVLELSHMGLIEAVLKGLDEEIKGQLVKCMSEKNLHQLRSLCRGRRAEEAARENLELLVSAYGGYKEVLPALKKAQLPPEAQSALAELETVCRVLEENGLAENLNLDFSIVNDRNYYSGILYKGFVKGIPCSILSGGCCDGLMEKMGKDGRAAGFAVYLDDLNLLKQDSDIWDCDTVLLYDEETDPGQVLREAEAVRTAGETVRAERTLPQGLRCRKLAALKKGEVKILERND